MYKMINLLFDRCHKVIKRFEITRITGPNGDLFSCLTAPSVIHNHIHHAAHADLADVGIGFKAAFQVRLHAAAWSPVPCL